MFNDYLTMKIDRNAVAMSPVAGLDDRADSLPGEAYRPDPLSVSLASTLSEKDAADSAAAPSSRGARSVAPSAPLSAEPVAVRVVAGRLETANTPGMEAAGPSAIASDSLMGTRILAVRSLLGDEAKHIDDENLLLLGNKIHNRAQALLNASGARKRVDDVLKNASPEDAAAIELSEALLFEETRIWLDRNGGSSSDEEIKRSMTTYSEAWRLTLAPPPAPVFQTRKELAVEHIKANKIEPRTIYVPIAAPEYGIPSTFERLQTKDELIDEIADSSDIKKAYFKQFETFVHEKLDTISTFKALAAAQSAGISGKELEQTPVRIHAISKADRFSKGVPIAFIQTRKETSILDGGDNRPCILEMPGNTFFLLHTDGSIKNLGKVLDENRQISSAKIMAALIDTLKDEDKGVWQAALKSNNYAVATEPITGLERCNLRTLLEIENKMATTAAVKSWQDSNYDATGLYGFARAVVPFFQVIEDSQNDPQFELKFKDIAWDVLDLGITLATIAMSAGAGSALTVGAKTFWSSASTGAGLALKAGGRAAIAAFKNGFKLSALLKTAGKELADFVVPVFTVADLGKAGARAAGRGLNAAKLELSDAARMLLARGASNAQDVTRGATAGAGAIKLTDTRPIERYGLPSLPAPGHDNGKGLVVVGSNEYAQLDGSFYRVRKDHGASTKERPIWRIQSPDGAQDVSLDTMPLRLEFKEGKWKRVNEPGRLLGGAPDSLPSNEFGTNYKKFLSENPVVNTVLGYDRQRELRATVVNECKEAWVSFVKNEVGGYDFKVFPPIGHPLAGTSEGISMIPGYWIPDTGSSAVVPGFVDIPKQDPKTPYVFTGGMNGCALIVTQAPDPQKLRVWHARTVDKYDVWEKIGVPREKAFVFGADQYYHEEKMGPVLDRMRSEDKSGIGVALNFLAFENGGWKVVSATNAFASAADGRTLAESVRVGPLVEVPVVLPA
jgi:hypothetical protein